MFFDDGFTIGGSYTTGASGQQGTVTVGTGQVALPAYQSGSGLSLANPAVLILLTVLVIVVFRR